jgi:hypothetical protein
MKKVGVAIRFDNGKFYRGHDNGSYGDGGPIEDDIPLVLDESRVNQGGLYDGLKRYKLCKIVSVYVED